MTDVYEEVRKIRQRSSVLQTVYKNIGQKSIKYEPGDLVRIWIKSSKMDRYYTVGRIVEHLDNVGFAQVKIMRYGKWRTEHVRVTNMAPYTPYTDDYFTSAPEKYSISQEPPQNDQHEVEQKLPQDELAPEPTKGVLTCKVDDFVVIPAHLWMDIELDKLPYSIAKCLSVYTEKNITFGIFQRYGNYYGKRGITQQQKPGYIDRKDKKYFYTLSPKSRSLPYSNDLQALGLPKMPIMIRDITIVFRFLNRHCVPKETQKLIDAVFPEIIQYRNKS